MLKRVAVLAAAGLVVSATDAAVALEYCVTCEGPPAMYRCVIDGTSEGPGRDPRVSLYCISQMATRGKHEACAVSRGAPFPCPGLTAVVRTPADLSTKAAAPTDDQPRPQHPGAAAPAEMDPHDGADTAEPAPAKASDKSTKVPRTVEELAGQTVRSSQEGIKKAGEQIGNAGSAIGNAASQTWTCITSLFSTCGGEAAEAEDGPDG